MSDERSRPQVRLPEAVYNELLDYRHEQYKKHGKVLSQGSIIEAAWKLFLSRVDNQTIVSDMLSLEEKRWLTLRRKVLSLPGGEQQLQASRRLLTLFLSLSGVDDESESQQGHQESKTPARKTPTTPKRNANRRA